MTDAVLPPPDHADMPRRASAPLAPAPFWFLLAAQFVVAAAGLVVEIVAGRMLAPYVGMSLYTWTAVIAVVLAGFSAGHWAGGLVADRPARTGLMWLAVSGALGAIATIAALPLLRWVSGPVLSSLTDPVAGYLFISWLGTARTLIAVTAAYTLFALCCLWMARRVPRNMDGTSLTAAAGITVLALFATAAGPFLPQKVCDIESRYYCIRSLDVSADFGAPTRLMVLDHLGHGINVLGDPARLEMPYAAIIDAVTRARLGDAPKQAYFIGGGSLTLPRAWTRDGARPGLVVAEIDPQVTRMAARDFDVDPSRFTVVHADARARLASLGGFQVIVGDAFTDIAVPAHLVTREFYAEIAESLAENGHYAMNLIDHMDRLQALAATVRTLRTAFPVVEVWVEAEDFTAGGRTTFVLIAGRTPTPQARFVLPPVAEGAASRILARMPTERIDALVARIDPPVLSDDYVPIDRLMGPGS